jgi:caffeoyl-CoA O-methyltransferase
MDFISPEIERYALEFTTAEDKVLAQLARETHLKTLSPRMLSGHLQGAFLTMISSALQPSCALEIGTFTGYSAICLAKGLKKGGKLITIDVNEETEQMARNAFAEAGLNEYIEFRLGNALEIIPEISGPFDLVFIDADKKNYPRYFDLVIEKVRVGGLIITDNVLWSGKVLDEEKNMDPETFCIHAFNRKVREDVRVETVLLPIRDGLMVARKK